MLCKCLISVSSVKGTTDSLIGGILALTPFCPSALQIGAKRVVGQVLMQFLDRAERRTGRVDHPTYCMPGFRRVRVCCKFRLQLLDGGLFDSLDSDLEQLTLVHIAVVQVYPTMGKSGCAFNIKALGQTWAIAFPKCAKCLSFFPFLSLFRITGVGDELHKCL